MSITFLLALYFDWTLGYLAPVFASPMLQASTRPSFAAAARVMFAAFLLMLGGYLLGGFARAYPLLFLVTLLPALFWTFRYHFRGGAPLVVLLILLALMLVPMVAKMSMQAAWDVAFSSFWNTGLALVVTFLMFAVFPPLPTEPPPKPKVAIPAVEVDRRAWMLAVITGVYTIAYFCFDWTNVHTPIYIAIFVQQLSLARGRTLTKGILVANIAAGLVGWVMYELFTMVPNLTFVALLSLTVILILARMTTSGSPTGPLVGAALSVLVIVLGSSMNSFMDDETAKFTDRLGEIGMAAIYAVAALQVLEAFFPERKRTPEPV